MPAPTALLPGPLHPRVGQDVPWLLRARAQATPHKTFLVFAPFDTNGLAEALVARIQVACAQQLADFKRPHAFQVKAELPRVTLGKIDKKQLRQQLR